ncbi:MAG: LysR family transcriptional regulator [Bryobacterales bacterium]|nr:LysR family transcriptional regulator [Bryobacterales bacterium]
MHFRADSDHLRLFRDVVIHKSISKGAQVNGVSQSAASQHIQELERRLDVALLDRSTRPFTVTETGQRYLRFCQDVILRCEAFDAELEQLKNEVSGTLRVAAIYSVGLTTMSDVEETFRARFPAASLEVTYLRPERVYQSVESDVCDIGLLSYPEPTRELEVIPWLNETMVLGAAPDHPLARKSSVTPHEMIGAAFIGFDQDLPIRMHIDRFLREHKVHVQRVMSFDNIQMIKEALVLGRGVAILPLRVMDAEIQDGRLCAIRIDTDDLIRPLGIIHRRKRPLSRVAKQFCDLLQREFSTSGAGVTPAAELAAR